MSASLRVAVPRLTVAARLIVINGPPECGKSMLARRYTDEHPLALNLDIDVLRSFGVRSTVAGFHLTGVQTGEKLSDRPLGPEHVKGHMLTLPRNDLVFALRL